MKKRVKISKKTNAFIHSITSLDAHYHQTFENLMRLYGNEIAYEKLMNEYVPAFRNLREVLQGFLIESIDSNIQNGGYEEI